MLRLKNILFEDEGKKVVFQYVTGIKSRKYFDLENQYYIKYQKNVTNVPQSILVIPFLSNILPIAWFAGFDVQVDDVDEAFFNAALHIKQEFQKQFPDYKLKGNLISKKLTKNEINGSKSAMLFSGGVDAYATYIRIYAQTPDLITVLGADIDIKDSEQWTAFTNFLENEPLLKDNKKQYIETNVRLFYTYHVELLLKDIGWWGKVQHGLSLIGSLAPLSYINNYSQLYIASSYTEHIDIAWGSTPQIDQNITWASNVKVHHDGYELKRQDKVDLITHFAKDTNTELKLRVCYSELRNSFNCSHCEKCYRTILGIILNGQNPNNYGFKVDENVYRNIFETLKIGGASKGMQYFWWELMEKAKNSNSIFTFKDSIKEKKELDSIRQGSIHKLLENKIKHPNKSIHRLRFILRNEFPNMYKRIKGMKF